MGTDKKYQTYLVTDIKYNKTKMLRAAASRLVNLSRPRLSALAGTQSRFMSASTETDEEFDARWEAYFKNPELDSWELRHGMNVLYGYDLVPEPKIIDAALHACRRLNEFAVSVRIFEMIKDKSGGDMEIYNYVIQQCRPTINELGLNTPEELGLD